MVENWLAIMQRTKKLTAFTATYSQASVIFPYVLVAPAYFAEKVQLGGMMQTASAFSSVQDLLSFFITSYRTLAEWQSVVARLSGFERAIENAAALTTRENIIHVGSDDKGDDRPRQAPGQSAQRHPAGDGGRFFDPQRRAHIADGPLGLGEIDAVPRHRRDLAVRDRLDRDSRAGHADDVAAAATSRSAP